MLLPLYSNLEKMDMSLLEAAADELIKINGEIVALYSGFQQGRLDSISHLKSVDPSRPEMTMSNSAIWTPSSTTRSFASQR